MKLRVIFKLVFLDIYLVAFMITFNAETLTVIRVTAVVIRVTLE